MSVHFTVIEFFTYMYLIQSYFCPMLTSLLHYFAVISSIIERKIHPVLYSPNDNASIYKEAKMKMKVNIFQTAHLRKAMNKLIKRGKKYLLFENWMVRFCKIHRNLNSLHHAGLVEISQVILEKNKDHLTSSMRFC